MLSLGIPYLVLAIGGRNSPCSSLGLGVVGMTSVSDQKAYWNLLETVRWICTRDEEKVAAMWNMDEDEQMAVALFDVKPRLDPNSLLIVRRADPNAAEPLGNGKPSGIDNANMMDPQKALDDLLRKVRSRRVQMTAIRYRGDRDEQEAVPPIELNDLIFRLHPGDRLVSVGLWSRSRDTLVWRSPQFARADVIGAWPGRNRKTAAVTAAIRRHLREITTAEAPLTKFEAEQRCMAEVPNAYREAFRRAWPDLEPSFKKGRGKHGRRAR
jgi:hypothetical protein